MGESLVGIPFAPSVLIEWTVLGECDWQCSGVEKRSHLRLRIVKGAWSPHNRMQSLEIF